MNVLAKKVMLARHEQIVVDWPLSKSRRVRTLITTRAGGVSIGARSALNLGKSVGDDPACVGQNRQIVAETVAAQGGGTPRWMSQVHGVDVVDLDSLPADAPITADAAIARRAEQVCTVMTADCLPLLFCDRQETVVAAAHAGWRGLAAGVIEATLARMAVRPEDVLVYLGPAIGPTAFEVGAEVRDAFLGAAATPEGNAANALSGAAFQASPSSGPGKWLANLYTLARVRLGVCGVPASQIYGGSLCTYTEEARFFSHRRATHQGSATGRMASLIWLAAPG